MGLRYEWRKTGVFPATLLTNADISQNDPELFVLGTFHEHDY